MKLIHRFEIKVTSDHAGETTSSVMTSFYREHLDPAYQQMIIGMLEQGLFDPFIGSVIYSTTVNGK